MQSLLSRYNGPEAEIQADLLSDGADEFTPTTLSLVPSREEHAQEIPSVVLAALKTHPAEVEAAASMLLSSRNTPRLLFSLPVGDFMFRHLWSSQSVKELQHGDTLLVRVRSSEMSFSPRVGAVMSLAEEKSPNDCVTVQSVAKVTEYAGVDMLVFIVLESVAMQKEGRIAQGAPSVVSGRPSTKIVDNEPLADDESIPKQDVEIEKRAAAALAAHAQKSFLNTRP